MTMGEKITQALTKAGLPLEHSTIAVITAVMGLMEGSYHHGYDDGKEDAEEQHKHFLMKVLKRELKGKLQ